MLTEPREAFTNRRRDKPRQAMKLRHAIRPYRPSGNTLVHARTCGFRYIGLGHSIHSADIPARPTKKTPAHDTIEATLRRGQILGFGRNPAVKNAVAANR